MTDAEEIRALRNHVALLEARAASALQRVRLAHDSAAASAKWAEAAEREAAGLRAFVRLCANIDQGECGGCHWAVEQARKIIRDAR